jgi:hypothetical protein
LKHPRLREALDLLERAGDRRTREGYARYGIVAPKSLGVPMAKIRRSPSASAGPRSRCAL